MSTSPWTVVVLLTAALAGCKRVDRPEVTAPQAATPSGPEVETSGAGISAVQGEAASHDVGAVGEADAEQGEPEPTPAPAQPEVAEPVALWEAIGRRAPGGGDEAGVEGWNAKRLDLILGAYAALLEPGPSGEGGVDGAGAGEAEAEAERARIVEALRAVALDPGEPVALRTAATAGLGHSLAEREDPSLLAVIVGLSADPQLEVRAAAIRALGSVGGVEGRREAQSRLMEHLTAPDAEPPEMMIAASVLAGTVDLAGLDRILAWYRANRARPGVSMAVAQLLAELSRGVVTSEAVVGRVRAAYDAVLGDTAIPVAGRVVLMHALGDRIGDKLLVCRQFLASEESEIRAAAQGCVAKAEDATLAVAGASLRLGMTRAEVVAAIAERGELDEAGRDQIDSTIERDVPRRRGATYLMWATGGVDDLVLVFVAGRLSDIAWSSSTAGDTELQQALRDDLEERLGQGRFDGEAMRWTVGDGTVIRRCWMGGDSGDSGCAYAIVGAKR